MIPDSSMRYLLALDSRTHQAAYRAHLDFIEAKPHIPIPISFKRIPSKQFYEYINRRLINVHKLEKLAVPALSLQELDRPLSDFLKKDFLVLPKESTLADVIRKFKESKAELIVIQDKNNKVVGTISPHDLLSYLHGTGNGGGHART